MGGFPRTAQARPGTVAGVCVARRVVTPFWCCARGFHTRHLLCRTACRSHAYGLDSFLASCRLANSSCTVGGWEPLCGKTECGVAIPVPQCSTRVPCRTLANEFDGPTGTDLMYHNHAAVLHDCPRPTVEGSQWSMKLLVRHIALAVGVIGVQLRKFGRLVRFLRCVGAQMEVQVERVVGERGSVFGCGEHAGRGSQKRSTVWSQADDRMHADCRIPKVMHDLYCKGLGECDRVGLTWTHEHRWSGYGFAVLAPFQRQAPSGLGGVACSPLLVVRQDMLAACCTPREQAHLAGLQPAGTPRDTNPRGRSRPGAEPCYRHGPQRQGSRAAEFARALAHGRRVP